MMDYIANLMQRGLISPDAAQNLADKIAWRGWPSDKKPTDVPLEGGGRGIGPPGGASGKPTVAPDYSVATKGVQQPLRKWSSTTIDQAMDLINQGKSHSEIAEMMGRSKDAVSGMVRRQNNPVPNVPRRSSVWNDEKDARLRDLIETGTTYTDAAQTMTMTRGAIAGRARKLNLQSQNAPFGYQPSAERTPSMPQLKSLLQMAPPEDPEMAKAMADYLDRSR